MKFRNIPVEQIYKRDNIREEAETELADLAESIDQFDVIQPILVRPVGDRYEIVSGHRRFLAVKMHGDPTVPCIIRDDIPDSDRIYIQLVENTHRKQMSAAELVDTFDRLKAKNPGLTNARIAARLGRSVQWVSNQYYAAKLAEKLDEAPGPGGAARLTAGQVFARARKQGVVGIFRKNGKVKIEFRGNAVRILCNGAAVRDEVLRILDRHFPADREIPR